MCVCRRSAGSACNVCWLDPSPAFPFPVLNPHQTKDYIYVYSKRHSPWTKNRPLSLITSQENQQHKTLHLPPDPTKMLTPPPQSPIVPTTDMFTV